MSLEGALKVSQVAFYCVATIVTLLTYWRTTRKGLLNTVFAEYQKLVIIRLKELSDELFADFDADSDNYWASQEPLKEVVHEINLTFVAQRAANCARR